jgi:hypothetical protein
MSKKNNSSKIKYITIHSECKFGNRNISTKQSAKIFNNHTTNYVDELITQQPNNESLIFSLMESFPYEFPQIINIPVTETQVICTISSLKNTTSCGYDGLSSNVLELCSNQISKTTTFIFNKSLKCDI